MARYFSISELIKSNEAIKRRIWNGANTEQESNITALVNVILDPLRDAYHAPITVTSGFRNARVNKLVGGVRDSQHTKGEAADITGGTKTRNKKLMRLIVDLGLPFDQMINEHDYAWVHVSYKRVGDNRGQILRFDGKSYVGIRKEDL